MSYVYKTILDFIYSLKGKNYVIQNFDSKNIKEVIENYKRIQNRYQMNQQIIGFNEQHRLNLVLLINRLKNQNKDLNDDYIEKWIAQLEAEHFQLLRQIEELEEHQKIFSNFTENVQFGKVKKEDDENLCEICEENKKDRSLDCGHVFCDLCINQMDNCPKCRVAIVRNNIRPVFL